MTLLDAPKSTSDVDEAQLLFQEAKERRRRRWLTSGISAGIVVVIVAALLAVVLGRSSGGNAKPSEPTGGMAAVGHANVSLSFRPVLCYAPALALAPGQSASTGSLPPCSPASQLTAANLNVNTATGQSFANPPEDTRFSTYHSTSNATAGEAVLLPGSSAQGSARYVLGPAALTQTSIASATAVVQHTGMWSVDLRLTPRGSLQWDTLAQVQFHAVIGVVVNGKVVSAPIVLPSQSSFTSFGGRVQISGGFTEQQAKALVRGV